MTRFLLFVISALLLSYPAPVLAGGLGGFDPTPLDLGMPSSEQKSTQAQIFTPFQTSDWIGLGLTTLADFADMDSSYSVIEHNLHIYNTTPRYGTPEPCPAGSGLTNCYSGHRILPAGEGNPLITGLFGTKYPTALDYTAFGVLELGLQAAIAWALPESWRDGAWGLFIGIGAADTICNAYGGGVTFRF